MVVLTADKGLGKFSRGHAVFDFPIILIKKSCTVLSLCKRVITLESQNKLVV